MLLCVAQTSSIHSILAHLMPVHVPCLALPLSVIDHRVGFTELAVMQSFPAE
jgi:hypothetical protein